MKNAVFGKTMESVTKTQRYCTTEIRRTYLVSETDCHRTKFFTKDLLGIEMKKSKDTYE